MRAADIRRIHYGYVVVPEEYPDAGQPLVVTGFVVPHPDGLVLFDTGMAPVSDEVRERYHPRRRSACDALAASGVDAESISAIVNCHQHMDHSGGNWEFPGVPIYVQRTELENARDMLAGQAAESWSFGGAVLSERLEHELGDKIGTYPEWARMLRERNVQRALLSHELMVWERDASEIGQPAPE